jgi:hypothetical protein
VPIPTCAPAFVTNNSAATTIEFFMAMIVDFSVNNFDENDLIFLIY